MPHNAFPVSFYLLLLCLLAAANVTIYRSVFAPPMLSVSVLAVGKGSATLVRTSSGKTLLIDTGPDASILRALGIALPEWQRSIDNVILTGEKAAFSGGLAALESRYRISTRTSIGDHTLPYGTGFTFDKNTTITIIAPGTFGISYGTNSLLISSTTPIGTYALDGKTVARF